MGPPAFTVPAPWFNDICDQQIINNDPAPDYGNISCTMLSNDNPDQVLSAINHIYFMIRKYPDGLDIVIELLCSLEGRWVELFRLGSQVMRESAKLIALLPRPPVYAMKICKDLLASDAITADFICDIWIDKGWKLTAATATIFKNCDRAWHFMAIDEVRVSRTLNSLMSKLRVSRSLNSLLQTNKSCLEYLLEVYPTHLLIHLLRKYVLLDPVLLNEAARSVIDYILLQPGVVNEDESSIRGWLIPRIESSVLIVDYITFDDLNLVCFTDKLLLNPKVGHIILDWIIYRTMEKEFTNELVLMASCGHKCVCYRIYSLLDAKHLTDRHWSLLIQNKLNLYFIETELKRLGRHTFLDKLFIDHCIKPFVSESSSTVCNLNGITVLNIDDHTLNEISAHPVLLKYDDWIALFQIRRGVEIGLNNLYEVIDAGVLCALFRSKLITTPEIFKLVIETEVLEYCEDSELYALASRSDAYETDMKLIEITNRAINDELLAAWHDPDRISRFAARAKMSFREYLTNHI